MASVLFSFVGWILLDLMISAGIFGLIAVLPTFILLSWFFKYNFVLLEYVALGYRKPPILSLDMVNPFDEQRPFKLLLVFAVMYIIYSKSILFIGPFYANVLVGIYTFLIPVCIIVVSIEDSIFQTLNPLNLISTIVKLGWHYLILVVAMLTLVSIPTALNHYNFWFIFTLFATVIAVFIFFSFTGLIVYRNRTYIGLIATHSDERTRSAFETSRKKLMNQAMDEVFLYAQAARIGHAMTFLQEKLKDFNYDDDVVRYFYDEINAWEDKTLLFAYAQHCITSLMHKNRIQAAYEITNECIEINPEFKIEYAHHAFKLAEFGLISAVPGYAHTAVHILSRFDKYYNDTIQIPNALLLYAESLVQQFNRDNQALEIFKRIISDYPTHITAQNSRKWVKILQLKPMSHPHD